MICKKLNRLAKASVVLALATLVLVSSQLSVYAAPMATQLTITYIATNDQNWNVKTVFGRGDQARFVVYVKNPSQSPDSATLQATVTSGGYTLLKSSPWNVTIPGNSTPGYAWIIIIPQNAPYGTYRYHATVTDSQGSVGASTDFKIVRRTYDAGNYDGQYNSVAVGSYNEPNDYQHRNYCGPGASQVLISAWTSNVPDIETLATQEKTDPNSGTLMVNMVGPINNAIGQNYYSVYNNTSSQADFSNMIGRDILDNQHPLITGILTIYGKKHLNGWSVKAQHIITIYGFNFSSPTAAYIDYYETSGTVAGTTATGPNSIDYNEFWALVQQNNVQLA